MSAYLNAWPWITYKLYMFIWNMDSNEKLKEILHVNSGAQDND